MADALPGMNVFGVLAQVPLDLANLGARQATEVMSVLNVGMQRLNNELAVPPALPSMAGMQGLPALPGLPGLAPAAGPAPAAGAQAADVFSSQLMNIPVSAAGPRVVI